MNEIKPNEITQPAGKELLVEAEKHVIMRSGQRVLSIGCGNGEIECYLSAKYGCIIDGVDVDKESIAVAKAKAARQGLSAVHFKVADAQHQYDQDHSVDLVLCCGGLTTNQEKDLAILSQCRRVVKECGHVVAIMTMWAHQNVTSEIKQLWRSAQFLVPLETAAFFAQVGFEGPCVKMAVGPEVWEQWCNHLLYQCEGRGEDKNAACEIEQMRQQCLRSVDSLGVGLFILRPIGKK